MFAMSIVKALAGYGIHLMLISMTVVCQIFF